MTQPRDTEYILIREKQDPATRKAKILITKNDHRVDLKDYTFFGPKPGSTDTMDRYVHNDDYPEYIKLFQN